MSAEERYFEIQILNEALTERFSSEMFVYSSVASRAAAEVCLLGDSATMEGNPCSNCRIMSCPCTHDIPAKVEGSSLAPSGFVLIYSVEAGPQEQVGTHK